MQFSERLMQLRRQKGWSQEELGERLGVTRQTVSKWELGSTTPEMDKLIAMSKLFDISLDELIPENPETGGEQSVSPTKAGVGANRRFRGEYKSARTWNGLPLVHINARGQARGVLAIGLASRGIFSIGLASMGVVSIGIVSLGLLAIGWIAALGVAAGAGLSVGVFAAGGVALGLFAVGGVSVGWFAVGGFAVGQYALGGCAVGEAIAAGGAASGTIAIGDSVSGDIMLNPPVSAEDFRAIVAERLPNTPQFIIDFFARAAETLHIE